MDICNNPCGISSKMCSSCRMVYFNELDMGGHFAAFEQPEASLHEVRTRFRTMRM
jgi:hypothetical protein